MHSGHKAIAIVLALAGTLALAEGRTLQEQRLFEATGFDTDNAEVLGSFKCSPSSSEEQLKSLVDNVKELEVLSKREALIKIALGYATMYKPADARAKENIPKVIAQLTSTGKVKPGETPPDWCATFVEMLADQVDQRYPDPSTHNLFSHKDSWSEGNVASAAKLMQIYGPDPVRPAYFGGKRPKKIQGAFLPADKKPVPGCMAVYQERDKDNDSWTNAGHMALVVSVDSDGKMETVEGNSYESPDSHESGIYIRNDRSWGEGKTIEYTSHQNGQHHTKRYRGCILPWAGMAKLPGDQDSVCATAVSDHVHKALVASERRDDHDAGDVRSGSAK